MGIQTIPHALIWLPFSRSLSVGPVVEPKRVEDRMILLVGVPLLVLVVLSAALCGLVWWRRSHRQFARTALTEDVTTLKMSSGADPTYGVGVAALVESLW